MPTFSRCQQPAVHVHSCRGSCINTCKLWPANFFSTGYYGERRGPAPHAFGLSDTDNLRSSNFLFTLTVNALFVFNGINPPFMQNTMLMYQTQRLSVALFLCDEEGQRHFSPPSKSETYMWIAKKLIPPQDEEPMSWVAYRVSCALSS